MSYIQTLKIADLVKPSDINNNVSGANPYTKIIEKIKTVTGWKTFDSSDKFQIGSFNHLNLEFNMFCSSSVYTFTYKLTSSPNNDNTNDGEVSIEGLCFTINSSNGLPLYLHYCKSKTTKTIGSGFSTDASKPKIDFVIAEDENGDLSGIGLGCAVDGVAMGTSTNYTTNHSARIIWKGNKCYINEGFTTTGNNQKGTLVYGKTATKVVGTSLCKMPNFLSGCMFNEVYMILSCPLSPTSLVNTVLDINGKKYQGFCNQFETNTDLHANSLSILAG